MKCKRLGRETRKKILKPSSANSSDFCLQAPWGGILRSFQKMKQKNIKYSLTGKNQKKKKMEANFFTEISKVKSKDLKKNEGNILRSVKR